MVLGAGGSLAVTEIRRCLREVAGASGGAAPFAGVGESEIRAALAELARDARNAGLGMELKEVAGGFRFQSDPACGPWLRHLLRSERPGRLSQPSLETLAIVAYRQPVTRSEIEAVRGVNVDHVVKTLMELQLVRIVGRSRLPGRPFLYGTTHRFLEHFGLRGLEELNEIEPMLRMAEAAGREAKRSGRGAARGGEPESGKADAGAANVEENGEDSGDRSSVIGSESAPLP